MRPEYLKTVVLILVFAFLIVFADQIQDIIVRQYNKYVETLASKTLASSNLNGF